MLLTNELFLKAALNEPKVRSGFIEELSIPDELRPSHDQLIAAHSQSEPIQKTYGRLAGAFAKAAGELGFDSFLEWAKGTDSMPRIRRLGRTPEGKFVGLLGDKVVPIRRLGIHKSGYRIAELDDGRRVEVRTKVDEGIIPDSWETSTSRATGIVLGLAAAPFQAGWGFVKGSIETAREAEQRGYGFLESAGIATAGGIAGGIRSAVESIFKRGSFGTGYHEAVKTIFGKTVGEAARDLAGRTNDPAEKSRLRSAARTLLGLAGDTVDLLIQFAVEGGPLVAKHKLGQTLRQIKYGAPELMGKKFLGVAPELDKTLTQAEAKTLEKISKYYAATQSERATRVVKDLEGLLSNPKNLENVLESIARHRKELGIDGTAERILREAYAEVSNRVKLLTRERPEPKLLTYDAVEHVKQLWDEAQDSAAEKIKKWEAGQKLPPPTPRQQLAEAARRLGILQPTKDFIHSIYETVSNKQFGEISAKSYKLLRTSRFKEIFDRIRPLGTKILLLDKDHPSAFAQFDGVQNRIIIYGRAFRGNVPPFELEESLAHEGLHSIVYNRLKSDASKYRALKRELFKFQIDLRVWVRRHVDELEKLPHDDVRQFIHMLKESNLVPEELITYGFTDRRVARVLSRIPFEVHESKTFWSRLKKIIFDIAGVGKQDKTALDELHRIMDDYVGGGFQSIHEPYEITNIRPNTITLEMSGLKGVFEMLGVGLKRAQGIFKNWRNYTIDTPYEQADDVLDEVVNILKHEYERVVKAEKFSPEAVMRRKARDQGWKLIRKKGGKGYSLIHADGRRVAAKDIDDVASLLSLGNSAKQYADEAYQLELFVQAREGLKDFEEKFFPNGIRNASPRQWAEAVRRMQKEIVRGPKPRFGDRWLKQFRTVFSRTPSGHRLWQVFRAAEDEGMVSFADDLFEIEKIVEKYSQSGETTKVTKEFLDDVRLYLDGFGVERRTKSGRVIPPSVDNPQARLAAEEIRPILTKLYEQAKKAGIKVAGFRENYFPRTVPELDALKSGPKRKEILEATVREGIFKTIEDAGDKLDGFIRRAEGDRTDNRFIEWLAKEQDMTFAQAEKFWDEVIMPKYIPVTGHLTKRRIYNLPWYDRNLLTALSDYMLDSHRAIAQYKHFGPRKERVWNLIDRMRVEGGNYELATDILGRLTNPRAREFRGPGEFAKKLLVFQSITKLNPLTTLVNFSQTLATGLRTRPSTALRAIANYDKEFAQRSAAIVNQTIKDIMVAHGATSPLGSKYMRAIGFTKSEQILRTIAANAGKLHAQDMVEFLKKGRRVDYAKRQLRSLGLDPESILRRGRLTDEELRIAGKRISDETQFRGNVMDLPEQWLTGHGRILTQFKTFVYNQALLVKRSVIDEARHGNFRPLVYLLTVYPIVGTGYDVLINQILLGKRPPQSLPEWYWRGITAVGGLGLFQTALESVAFGEKAVLSDLLGPTVSDFARASQAYKLFIGKDFPIEKEVGSRLPFIGRIVRSRFANKSSRPRRRRRRR